MRNCEYILEVTHFQSRLHKTKWKVQHQSQSMLKLWPVPPMGRAYSADGKSRIRWWEDQIPPMRRPKSANGKRWSCVIIRCKVPIKCKFKEPMIQNHIPGVYPVPSCWQVFPLPLPNEAEHVLPSVCVSFQGNIRKGSTLRWLPDK